MKINEGVKLAYEIAKANGFHEEGQEKEFGTYLALIHSEVSEALEAHRRGRRADLESYKNFFGSKEVYDSGMFARYIKDTIEDELADTVIRVFDLCGLMGIDLETHVAWKMKYNQSRPMRHGKEY